MFMDPHRQGEQDLHAFLQDFPEFQAQVSYLTPKAVMDLFGTQTDEPELAVNGILLFGWSVWMRHHRKGNQAFVKWIIKHFREAGGGAEELYQWMLTRLKPRVS
jgi:hypothetical protein